MHLWFTNFMYFKLLIHLTGQGIQKCLHACNFRNDNGLNRKWMSDFSKMWQEMLFMWNE